MFGVTGLWNSLSGEVTVHSVLMATGGIVIVAATTRQWHSPSEPEPGWAVWLAVCGALLVVLGSVLAFFR